MSANFIIELEILSPFRFSYYRIVLSIPILFLYYPSLSNFSVSYYPFCVFTVHSLQFIVNCPRPVGVDFILLSIRTSLLQARPTLLAEPSRSYSPESTYSFAEPTCLHSEPLCSLSLSLFHYSRFVQLETLRSQCI